MLLMFTRSNVLFFSIKSSIFIIYQEKVAQTRALFCDYIYLFIYLLRISEKHFVDEAGLELEDLPASVP